MKGISSLPGALIFRAVISVLLISVVTGIFLNKTEQMTGKMDLIARQQVVNEINVALALVVYNLAVNNKLEKLNDLDKSNPFDYLALNQSLPNNYFGVVDRDEKIDRNGWFYAISKKQAVYNSRQGIKHWYQLSLIFNDINNSNTFDAGSEKLSGLQLKKASDQ
jgi:hypothetical protein